MPIGPSLAGAGCRGHIAGSERADRRQRRAGNVRAVVADSLTSRAMRALRTLPVAAAVAALVAGAAACSSAPARPSDPVLAKGYDTYTQRCASCHGVSGEGGAGPQMKGVATRLSAEKHLETVRNGRTGTAMIGFKDQLSDEEIQAVVRYEREVLSPSS